MTNSEGPGPADTPAPSAQPASPPPLAPSRKRARVTSAMWIGAFALIAVAAMGAIAVSSTAAPTTCTSCHEMTASVSAWKTSPHAAVGCPACHEPVRAWYQLPQSLAFRAEMLSRDYAAHGDYASASTLPTTTDTMGVVSDENCLHCHDLVREVTLPPGLVMDHAKHVKRNKSCVSCHRSTAHPPPDAEKPVLLMAQCFTCHGRQAGAKAPGTCELCHTKSFDMRPQSHSPSDAWILTHGTVAKANRSQCSMCHDPVFCDNCHGLPMPHPAGWADRSNPLHAPVALKNPTVCEHCHGGGVNLCTMCHHKGFDMSHGPWASNHAPTVEQRGAAACMNCHYALFCVTCHTTGKVLTPTRSSVATTMP